MPRCAKNRNLIRNDGINVFFLPQGGGQITHINGHTHTIHMSQRAIFFREDDTLHYQVWTDQDSVLQYSRLIGGPGQPEMGTWMGIVPLRNIDWNSVDWERGTARWLR